jgi:hypothetical protein
LYDGDGRVAESEYEQGRLFIGFFHLSEEVRGEDEAVQSFVGRVHDFVFVALPFFSPFIYIQDVFSDAHYGIHVMRVDDGGHVEFHGYVVNQLVYHQRGFGAIALNPKYLFCDEPNSGLDPKTSLVIDELIHDITVEFNMTTIINTHDMNSVMGIGENILYIYEGRKEWQGNKDEIMNSTNERLNSFIFASDLFRKVKEANK